MTKTIDKCWNCGEEAMVPFEEIGGRWLKCSKCGSTSMPDPTTIGAETLFTETPGTGGRESKYRPRKKRLPKARPRSA